MSSPKTSVEFLNEIFVNTDSEKLIWTTESSKSSQIQIVSDHHFKMMKCNICGCVWPNGEIHTQEACNFAVIRSIIEV